MDVVSKLLRLPKMDLIDDQHALPTRNRRFPNMSEDFTQIGHLQPMLIIPSCS